jgi:hypothetical protein
MQDMNNKAASKSVIRLSRSESSALRAKFAARRAEADVQKEIAEIKEDLRDRTISEGEALRREMIQDGLGKGARRGARSPSESCFDTSLIVRRLGGAPKMGGLGAFGILIAK